MEKAPVLYIVVPCYNEEEALPITAKRLTELTDDMRARGAIAPESRILLVDDVYTTGATMSTCAQALKDAGAATVWALTYAVAGNQPDDECPPMP